MRSTIGICMWAAVMACAPGAPAQESPAAKPAAERVAGKRLRVEFLETRQRGEATTGTRRCTLLLNADTEQARIFLGTQILLSASDRGTPTTTFKNAGIEARVAAETLPDGRYRLDARFEETSARAAGNGAPSPMAGDNPILQIVRGESRLTLREGETVPFASVVDPVTGEVVRVDVTVAVAPSSKALSSVGGARLRASYVLVRREGQKTVVRRPYSVILEVGSKEAANVFSGSMLPVQVTVQGQPTVMLKDVGAGLRLTADRTVADGPYRLDLSFSDGVLAAGKGSPDVRAFQSESLVLVHAGETVTVASVVDPQTGEVVEAELTIEAVR